MIAFLRDFIAELGLETLLDEIITALWAALAIVAAPLIIGLARVLLHG